MKDYFIEDEMIKELMMQDQYIEELEKENEALTERIHILQSQLNKKATRGNESLEKTYMY